MTVNDEERDTAEFLGRILPHSQELEQAVLGAMLQDAQNALPVAMEILTHESFYYPARQIIFGVLVRLHLRGVPPDSLSVTEDLRSRELLDWVGGESYLIALVAAVPDASAIEGHAQMLREKELLRKLISDCHHLLKEAYAGGQGAQQLIDEAEKRLGALSRNVGRFSSAGAAVDAFLELFEAETYDDGSFQLKAQPGAPSQFTDLQRVSGGFKRGEFIIIAARPSMGKTAFALSLVLHQLTKGLRVAFFSLEMSKELIAARLLSMRSRVPLEDVIAGNFTREDSLCIRRAMDDLAGYELTVDDSSGLTIRDLRSRIRQLARKGIDIVYLDYLQMMAGLGRERYEEMTGISLGLKDLCRELSIPVVALSQLNRQVEMRANKRPHLADLRESGALEQDADMVLLLYRPEYYDDAGPTELRIAKNRNGAIGIVYLTFMPEVVEFASYHPDVDLEDF